MAHKEKPADVWLYYTEYHGVIGYGSLGQTNWTYPARKGGTITRLQIIPNFGIDTHFHGKPEGVPREERFAARMLEDIVLEATLRPVISRLLGLRVHPDNTRAMAFYRNHWFSDYMGMKPYVNEDTGVAYLSMLRDLAAHPAESP